MTSHSAPIEVLERRLVFVRRNMNASQFYIENSPHALSQYTPSQRPVLFWDTRLSIEERTLAGVRVSSVSYQRCPSPDDPPTWLGRGNYSFGITSLEHAWAEAAQHQKAMETS